MTFSLENPTIITLVCTTLATCLFMVSFLCLRRFIRNEKKRRKEAEQMLPMRENSDDTLLVEPQLMPMPVRVKQEPVWPQVKYVPHIDDSPRRQIVTSAVTRVPRATSVNYELVLGPQRSYGTATDLFLARYPPMADPLRLYTLPSGSCSTSVFSGIQAPYSPRHNRYMRRSETAQFREYLL